MTSSITDELISEKRTKSTIRILYWIFASVMLLTIAYAWICYPEPYEFFQEFISNLGARVSEHENLPNDASSLIVSIGFGVCALISLVVAIVYLFKPKLKFNYWKSFLNFIMCIGAIGVGIPKDQPRIHILHGIGAALFMVAFGFLNFVHQRLRFTRKYKPATFERTKDFYLDSVVTVVVFVVLVMFVIFYALGKLLENDALAIFGTTYQKVALLVNFFAILILDLDDI
ncbi:MAG: hypothetical protein FK732_01245 [Asgard group archaeon]|nr:hypothetical protein [Asgard group archaeon]